jgi:hypothetical protein
VKFNKKYTLDERKDIDLGGIKITYKPLTSAQQARLADLAYADGFAARYEQTKWCLLNVIGKVSVNGEEFDPKKMSDDVDYTDADTAVVFSRIGMMVYHDAFASEEDAKKSSQPPEAGA